MSVCRAPPQSAQQSNPQNSKYRDQPVKMVDEQYSDDDSYENYLLVGSLGLHSVEDDIIWITPQVNSKEIKMELDTGSAKSIISRAEYSSMFGDTPLQETHVRFKTYTGERISPLGVVDVQLQYKGQKCTAPLYVLDGKGVALFGRDWLSKIKLDWHEIKTVTADLANTQLQTLLNKHQQVFDEGFGKLNGTQAKLHLKENAQPKF